MMKIVWLPFALDDMAGIQSYYTEVAGKQVADQQLKKITKAVRLLQHQPYIGHISSIDIHSDVLEWHIPSTSYTLPYMVINEEIRILRVFDERQERPEAWW